MSLTVYLWGIRLFTLFAFSAWIGVIIFLDPEATGSMGLGLFLVSLVAFLTGILTLCVTWVYRKVLGDKGTVYHLSGAFRQALLMALFVLGIIFFQYLRILTWWDTLLLLAAAFLIEFTFRDTSQHKDK